jgi:hypothetical protein
MKGISKTAVIVLLSVLMTILVVSIFPGNSASSHPAQADELGGVTGSSLFPPVLDGRRGYTTSVTYSSAVYVAGFGSAQIMLNSIVTGTQTITVTPQFSLQDLPCASVTQWFTSTTYQYYQPYSIATSSTTLTETIGAWQGTPITELFNVSGSTVGSREISTKGQCMRVMLTFSKAGQSYTPTLVIRALNRN